MRTTEIDLQANLEAFTLRIAEILHPDTDPAAAPAAYRPHLYPIDLQTMVTHLHRAADLCAPQDPAQILKLQEMISLLNKAAGVLDNQWYARLYLGQNRFGSRLDMPAGSAPIVRELENKYWTRFSTRQNFSSLLAGLVTIQAMYTNADRSKGWKAERLYLHDLEQWQRQYTVSLLAILHTKQLSEKDSMQLPGVQ